MPTILLLPGRSRAAVLSKIRRYRTLARYDAQDRDPERLNPRPEREAGVVVRRISGRPRVGNITTDIDP
jgi:hypothetical protein